MSSKNVCNTTKPEKPPKFCGCCKVQLEQKERWKEICSRCYVISTFEKNKNTNLFIESDSE